VGLSRSEAANYFRTALGLGIVGKMGLGVVSALIPRRIAIIADYGLIAISSIVLLMLPNDILIWMFVISYGFASAARDVVYPLTISTSFGDTHLAQIYGALLLTLLPGGALGPLFAAAVYDAFGNYDIAFTTFAVLNCIAVASLFLLRDERVTR
jgi:cyanate permease